ncbi:T9SS type A sorting domain-containing protein [Epilithonimonas sp. JDS]|uniref:right-handed parallel beta-helix repeat-containing protein n=1 Tax=Epilithonimonas sp. JDS TaxID=2902797 RepID=UPI001E527DD7|nr:right-handed parallel beta-helix repeat-containing protein [Epilithonimonas sp. JDS]MCD9854634.1 T9SS type A sorting domain-containing protein [Epilithonimonas sp. JDS]
MKKITLLFVMSCAFLQAQFTTPNNGTSYTLTSLSAAAPTVLVKSGTDYTLTADLTLAATDKLLIDENTTLKVNSGVAIFVYGEYKTTASNFTITASTIGSPYRGIRFEEGSVAEMKNTRIEYGGGVRVLTANPFLMDNCILYKNNNSGTTNVASSAALALFQGKGHVVKNSQFLENSRAGINSGASGSVSIDIINNYFYGNTTDANGNYPQINMGPGGVDSTRVINNTIIGNRLNIKAGGVSVSGLLGGTNRFRIEGNTIRDNRYGITHQGAGSTGIIRNNIIENNNSENLPNLGGSGISLTATSKVTVRNNQIRGNLWGITILSNAVLDLGTATDEGNNIFKNNVNAGNTVAFFNNTPNAVSAIGNCWREGELSDDAMVAAVIGSQTANTVTYKPYKCAQSLAVSDFSKSKISIYPNPSKNHFYLETENAGNIVIQDLSGKVVHSAIVIKGKNEITTNLQSGVYIITQQSEGKKLNTKLIIK